MARSTMNGDGDGTKPLSQIAYDALRSMILSGELKPGERLRERELARRVRVSRTPLREALGRLERDGLAVSKPGLGYFATEFDPALLEELYEFRGTLEVQASRFPPRGSAEGGAGALRDTRRQLGRSSR